jgi:hypothetical protein
MLRERVEEHGRTRWQPTDEFHRALKIIGERLVEIYYDLIDRGFTLDEATVMVDTAAEDARLNIAVGMPKELISSKAKEEQKFLLDCEKELVVTGLLLKLDNAQHSLQTLQLQMQTDLPFGLVGLAKREIEVRNNQIAELEELIKKISGDK